MNRIIRFFLIILVLSGCDENEKSFQQEASIFNGTTLMKTENFSGTVQKKEDLLVYKYKSQQDSSKTIFIEFNKTSKDLYFGTDEYERVNGRTFMEQDLSKDNFDFFDLKNPYADGTGPILFNQEYGLLAINNVFGPTIIFLSNNENKKLKNRILQELRK